MILKITDPKLSELILYICERCDMFDSWGRTKLAKLLYFSDFRHYRKHGMAITGADYLCRPKGPMPAVFYGCLEALTAKGDLVELKREIGDYSELRPTAVREASLEGFSAAEISTVEWVIETYGKLSAKALSDLSHKEAGWQLAGPGEAIPYEAALINTERMTPEEADFARKMAARQAA